MSDKCTVYNLDDQQEWMLYCLNLQKKWGVVNFH
jgi:hypothetical protein